MAVYKRDIIDINLETGNIYRSWLKHSIGMKDQKADHFGVRVFRNGEAVSLTGVSVQGVFMPPQGSPIAITSGNIVSGNVAEVVLPQACYNYDGQFTLAIKLVDASNSVTGTVRIVDGMVDNTHASGTVAPTSAVPTYQEVLSVYEQAITVIGKSVRFDTDQSLTDAQKTTARTNIAAASTGELSDLKSAIDNIETGTGLVEPTNLFNASTKTDGYIMTNNGASADSGYSYSDYIPVEGNKTYTFRGCYGNRIQIVLYGSSKNYLKQLYENQVSSGSYSGGHLTVDLTALGYPQTAFVIVNMTTQAAPTYMFVEGSEYPASYISYNEYTAFKSNWIVCAVKKIFNFALKIGAKLTIAGTQQQAISLGENAGSSDSLASIAIGTGALRYTAHTQDDEGYFNVAVGHGAMESATSSDHCTAVGYQAMKSGQTGKYNSAFGEDALMGNTNGNRNVAVGCRSMQSQTTGDDNVAVGALTTYSTDQTKIPTGSKNTYVGGYAGQVDGAGSNNVAVGYYAGRTSSALNNTVAVGYQAAPTKNNQMVLGSNVIDECKIYGNTFCFRRNTDGKVLVLNFNNDGTVTWSLQS